MARTFSKTLTVTRVAYKIVEVTDGIPQFVDRPDAVFSGILEKEKVERMLRGQLGKDAIIVVTHIDSGQHRYEMDLETFVLNARIADGEMEDSGDGEESDAIADAPDTSADATAVADPIPDSSPDPDPIPDAGAVSSDTPATQSGPAPAPVSNPVSSPTTQNTDGSITAPASEDNDEDGVDGVDDPF